MLVRVQGLVFKNTKTRTRRTKRMPLAQAGGDTNRTREVLTVNVRLVMLVRVLVLVFKTSCNRSRRTKRMPEVLTVNIRLVILVRVQVLVSKHQGAYEADEADASCAGRRRHESDA